MNADNYGDYAHSSEEDDYQRAQDRLADIESLALELIPTEDEIGDAIASMSEQTSADYHKAIADILWASKNGNSMALCIPAEVLSAHLWDAIMPILEERARKIIDGENEDE